MFNIDFTFIWVAVNLAIIYFIVNKFLFKRLGGFMDKRSAAISDDIEKGKALLKEGEEITRRRDELLAQAADERRLILEEAKQDASREYERIVSEAKASAERMIKEARESNLRERGLIYAEIRKDVAELAISAASKVIEANMDNEKNRVLVSSFLSKREVA